MSADLPNSPELIWSELDERAVNTAKTLAMDSVEKAGNGHPGSAISLAPAAYLLFNKVMRHDPNDPTWIGRDRFVLSGGHSSLTLYVQLYLSGFGLTLDDLRSLRQWGSLTPGHPEYGHTPGVETTTGPLGQGLGNAVGMAMAARRERGMYEPEAPAGQSLFDHTIYAICGDGDVQEGVAHEAAALAGRQALGNLVVIYDENHISIEDDTAIAFNEDVLARHAAYGWDVQRVDWTVTGEYKEDVAALYAAIARAKAVTDKPSMIALRTIIGWPSPTKQNTGNIHGSALGAAEVAAAKKLMGMDPEISFNVADEVLAHARTVADRGAQEHKDWQVRFEAWRQANPERAALLDRLSKRELPAGWTESLPVFPADAKGLATRVASGKVLNAIAGVLPELWGGSADLAGSTNTLLNGEGSFGPAAATTSTFTTDPYGRNLHFGIREHGMGAILNGMALHGGTRPYGATFMQFSDYMRPSVRLAALMKLPVVYVWTHDSIGLGEDGPTHQPVEHLSALRAIPDLDVVRPADANETAHAWRLALEHTDRPTALCLSRQNLPTLEATAGAGDDIARGGYVLAEASTATPKVVLIGTGSEVAICLEARELLEAEGVATRVVSMPCQEWFRAQDSGYQRSVLPEDCARVSVEAGIAMSWRDLVGRNGECVSLEHFGASAPSGVLYEKFGLTASKVAAAARSAVERTAGA